MLTSILTVLGLLGQVQPDGGTVTVKGRKLLAEVAVTERERSLGLAHRTLFKAERCLFVVPEAEGLHPVSTAKHRLAFDVAWVDEAGRVVETLASVPPCPTGQDCPNHGGTVTSRYHVFFQAGTLRRLKLAKGDRLGWDLRFKDGGGLSLAPEPAPAAKRPRKPRR